MKNNFTPKDVFEQIEFSLNFFRYIGLTRLRIDPNSILGKNDYDAMFSYRKPMLKWIQQNKISNSQLQGEIILFAIGFVLKLDSNTIPSKLTCSQKRKFKNTIEGITNFVDSILGITLEFNIESMLTSEFKISA